MSELSISPYFPFRRIKILKQVVDKTASKAFITIVPDKRFRPVCHLCGRVQYKKVTPIKLPTANPQLCCYQTYFSLPPILFGKHFSAYLSGLMNVERLYSLHVPASKIILFP